MSIDELSLRFRELLDRLRDETDVHRYVLGELNDMLTAVGPTEFGSMVADASVSGMTPFLQNYVAAMVEQAAHQKGVSTPAWAGLVPVLTRPWFASDLSALRLHLLKQSPIPFKRRNLFVDAGVGDRV